MKISRFILVVDSYLIRKGVVSLLNRIQGARIQKEFGSDGPLESYLQDHPVDYIIISSAGLDRHSNLFAADPRLLEKTIMIEESEKRVPRGKDQVHDVRSILYLSDEKEALIQKINDLIENTEEPLTGARPVELSPREVTIVRLVSMGLTNRQIAEQLFLSTHTVMTHRKNINNKLGIKSVSGLTIYAIVNNIITIEEVITKPVR